MTHKPEMTGNGDPDFSKLSNDEKNGRDTRTIYYTYHIPGYSDSGED